MVRRLLLGFGLALSLAPAARAAPITFQFAGVVTQVVDPITFDGSVVAGTPFYGSYTFDSEAVGTPSFPGSTALIYPASAFSFTVGNYQFRSLQTGADPHVIVGNDPDSYGAGSRSYDVDGVFTLVPPELVDVIVSPLVRGGFGLLEAEVFTGTNLPLSPPDPSIWPVNLFEIVADKGRVEPAFTITGRITSIVPEPSSGLALGLGLLALLVLPSPQQPRPTS